MGSIHLKRYWSLSRFKDRQHYFKSIAFSRDTVPLLKVELQALGMCHTSEFTWYHGWAKNLGQQVPDILQYIANIFHSLGKGKVFVMILWLTSAALRSVREAISEWPVITF